MKKYFLSLFLVLSFGMFALFQKPNTTDVAVLPDKSLNSNAPTVVPIAGPGIEQNADTEVPSAENDIVTPTKSVTVVKKPAPTPTPTPTPIPTPIPPPAVKPKGIYNDGTYNGNAVSEYYGIIQVGAVITNGRLVDVLFLRYPTDRGASSAINYQALPMLKTEAIQAQSASIDGISGASETSYGFIQSLASALAKAKN